MTSTAEDAVRRGDLARSASRDAEASVTSAYTQTRFSFYNAEDFSTTEESNPNRFNFYNEELQRQVAELPATPVEALPSHAGEQLTGSNVAENNADSIEILRSLQQHEQQRLTILNNSIDESTELSTDKSNPYEDAIKEALVLLRKHRTPGSSSSSAEGQIPASFSPTSQVRPSAIDTNQMQQSLDDGIDEDLFHAVQTSLPASALSAASHFDRGFYPSTPSDVMTPGSTSALGDAYQAEIEARRRKRQERMAKYATRLAELKQESNTVASSPTHTQHSAEYENETPSIAASAHPVDFSAPTMLHQHSSQPIVTFPAGQIPHVGSGLTTSSRGDDFHHQQIQLGVERVLLAILDRANSRGRGQQQAQSQSAPRVWRREGEKLHSNEIEHVLESEEEDPLIQVMSELLQKPTLSLADDTPLTGRDDLEQAFGIDTSRNVTLVSDTLIQKPTAIDIPDDGKTFSPELRISHSDPGPEAHAELDRMVEEVLKKNSESISLGSCTSSAEYASDPINQRVREVLSAESAGNSSDATASKSQKQSGRVIENEEDSDIYDSGEEENTLEDGLDDENEDRYGDEASSESDVGGPNILNGVLGPLSILAGGTTGVVLESDSSDSPSLFDSISTAARNFVAGVSSSSESEAAPVDAKSSSSIKKETSQAYELMQTLYAHLIFEEFPKTKKKLIERIPSWDEANPDELGYRVIRLTAEQLEQVEKEFEVEMRSRRKEKEKNEDKSFEGDLKHAQEQLEIEEREKRKGVSECFSVRAWSKDYKETDCLQEFPGIKPTGRGEMGDLEFFNLPIIFKSHVTGFEPTKDIYLEAGNIVAGQYLVEGEMGSAAFSTAYRCIDLNSEGDGPEGHEEVCLKVIKNTKDFFDQSLDEIKILELLRQTGMCDQKNILKMKTFFYYREHLIIVTELLRQNLFEFGKFITDNDEEPYFTISRLSYITRQCLIALDFVHKIGFVHSDIKPENILLASYSRAKIKVIDFGSSCYLTDRQSSYIQSRSYRAPEVVLGLFYDARIDLWSLGCVVAEMYTGEVTFQNDSVVSMLSRIEAICGPLPKRMVQQGRQSGSFYTSSGLLYEKVKKSRKDSEDSYSGDDNSSEGSGSETNECVDIFQPKKTSLAARLGFDANLMEKYDAGKQLSREQKKQAIFVDFVRSLLTVDPEKRPTAEEALKHPWMEYAATLKEADIKYP